ncbi:DUF5134 domain-containing protein [Citricoccus sp. NPDC079358]|nr:DUF5134 domain-containing protein [Paenarthrobacter aurescens]MDP9989136.1 hypothetical protein [Arthrobacter oryzae]
MFDNPAITWALTALLLAAGGYNLAQATRRRSMVDLANSALHVLMNAVMAAMLWNFASSTALLQVAVLGGGAFWFALQAAARPELKALCAEGRGRLRCAYHGLNMAAAALMVAVMNHPTAPHPDIMSAPGSSHNHHGLAAGVAVDMTGTWDYNDTLMILPAVFFAASSVFFLVLLLCPWALRLFTGLSDASAAAVRVTYGFEFSGAAAMALMFALPA